MNKSFFTSLFIYFFTVAYSQDKTIDPENNPFNSNLIQNEISEMTWFVSKDTAKIEMGKVTTEIKKQASNVLIITTVNLRNA